MERQFEILDELAQILFGEACEKYDYILCKFEVDGASVGTYFEYGANGKKVNKAVSDSSSLEFLDLILELHKDMKNHTGGDWSEFTLTIDENGQAKTKFKYPDQEPVR